MDVMPRKSRIDAPGALQHIIGRGIERRKLFVDDSDHNHFLDRIGVIITETNTRCYAWALLPNHFHLLLRTGRVPIATVMRRLLTGHAGYFNKRHRRTGHLFQNQADESLIIDLLCFFNDLHITVTPVFFELKAIRHGQPSFMF